MAATPEATLDIIEEDVIEYKQVDGGVQDYNVLNDNEVFEFDKIIEDLSTKSARAGSFSSIGSFGAESSFAVGRGGQRRSAKVSVCSSVSLKTVSEGTPPYISIMSRHDSLATETGTAVI